MEHWRPALRMCGLALAIAWLALLPVTAAEHPMNRIAFWQTYYAEWRPEDDPRAKRAHAIFQRVLRAAGARPGVHPRLFITATDPRNIALPIALEDGWVILSKGAIEICYRDKARGDHRLAFVLGHELAHHLKGDFWHMHFFQALEKAAAHGAAESSLLDELRREAGRTAHVLAQEIQADEQGIVYAAMAGFDTTAVVSDATSQTFFEEWAQALDPGRLGELPREPTHPTPPQRAATVKARLRQILAQVDLFTWGLRFYEAGEYALAVRAFEEFVRVFPSREVYHNLAASHHQLALQAYRRWQPQDATPPFKLSLTVDPVTRAVGPRRGSGAEQARFTEHLGKAVEFYQTAITLDPTYVPAYGNLGCALLLRGEAYEAVATLQKALKARPEAPEILNNLGVAFVAVQNLVQAQAYLDKAHERAPTEDAPLFNLGMLAYTEARLAEARQYWQAYLALDPHSAWADAIRQRLPDSAASPPPPGGPIGARISCKS